MFWGFVLEPKKRYNTTVTKPFHISMAALDLKSINDDDDVNTLVLNVDGTETILCHLTKPQYLQQRLDLNFIEGNTITLEVKGKAVVHLSGYFIYEQDGMDEDDDSDLEDEEEEIDSNATAKALKALKKQMSKKSKFNASTTEEDSDDDDSDESGDESMDVSDMTFDDDDDDDDDDDEDDDADDDDEDLEDEEDDEEEEIKMGSPGSTPMPPQKKGNKGASANSTPVSTNKKKHQQQQQQQQQQKESGKKNKGEKQQQSPQKALSNGTAPTTPGSNKKKKNKSENGESGTPKSDTPKQGGGAPTPKKSLEGGVIVEDMKVGSGAPAKSGRMVSVYYSGKLKSNNKQFDSTTQGPGFKFRLGKGEVIKGWDVGLSGMKVGGKRRITIPAHMAYGNKGSPPAIPPNSTLVFDVELKHVN